MPSLGLLTHGIPDLEALLLSHTRVTILGCDVQVWWNRRKLHKPIWQDDEPNMDNSWVCCMSLSGSYWIVHVLSGSPYLKQKKIWFILIDSQYSHVIKSRCTIAPSHHALIIHTGALTCGLSSFSRHSRTLLQLAVLISPIILRRRSLLKLIGWWGFIDGENKKKSVLISER